MPDDTKNLKQPNWGRDRGKNAGKNKSQEWEGGSSPTGDGRGWHGQPQRHADAARRGHRDKMEALIEKSKRENERRTQLEQKKKIKSKKIKSSKSKNSKEKVEFVAEGENVSFYAKKDS